MKLEYFAANARGIFVRMLLDYCNVPFDDVYVKDFGTRKSKGCYEYG